MRTEKNMAVIKEEILKAQQQLSRVNVDFLEFVQKKPEALKRSSYTDITDFPVGPRNKQPWPTFIDRRIRKQFQETSTGIFHLIRQIPGRIFDNNPHKLSAYFGFAEEYISLWLESVKGDHLENLLGRGDFIFSSTGLKCCEFNISANIAMDQMLTGPVYLHNPIIAKFLKEYRVKICNRNGLATLSWHLYTSARKKFPSPQHQEINIVVVIPGDKKSMEKDMVEEHFARAYREVLNQQGIPYAGTINIRDFSQLTVEKDCIFYKGRRIHIIMGLNPGEVPMDIFYVALLGKVIIYNGPITMLLTNKLNLALLSEHEDSEIFTPGERKILKAHIPWTRRIVPGKVIFAGKTFDWEDFLRSHRTKLVIKPALEWGGEGVGIGKHTPPDQWETIIQQALGDETQNWMAQEYMETLPHVYQYGEQGYIEHEVIWGLFVFGREYGGGFLRVIPKTENIKGVINTSQGAQETVFFEVDE
jgi:hypothetical protein